MKRFYFFNENDEDVLGNIKTEQIKINKVKKKVSESPKLIINDFNNLITKKNYIKHPSTDSGDEEDNPFEYLLKKKKLEKNWMASLLYALGLSSCIKLTHPNILYKHGKALLEYDLNALIILKKLIYFESVLKILFNEDQLGLLKVIRSRYVNVGMNIDEKLNNLQALYKGINEKSQVNQINKIYQDCYNEKTL